MVEHMKAPDGMLGEYAVKPTRKRIMKRNGRQFNYAAARAVAAATLVACIAFVSGPAIAAKTAEDRVEARIKDMHAKLNITQAQEGKWTNVAGIMRENAKTMDALTQARYEKAKTMSAIDDLKSYGEITDAHADQIRKFTPVFGTLYADMSDTQKKQADSLFRNVGQKKKAKSK